jgi:fatty-acyl-CoA synthase
MKSFDYQLNLKNIFPPTLRNFPDQEIVYRDLRRLTFKEFYDRVSRFSYGLSKIGVKPGDKVGILDWDTDFYVQSYFSIPMMGAVLHTVNIRYPPELIFYTMQHAEDKYVLIRDEFVPLIEKAAQLFDFVKGWIIYSDTNEKIKTTLEPHYYYSELIESSEQYEFPDLNENTIATIFYTSGTTGMPKGVTFTHRNIVLHAMALVIAVRSDPLYITDRDVFMNLVPLFHVHGWGFPHVTMITGNKYVLPGRYDIKRILELIKNERVTLSMMVPSILYMILTHPEIEDYAKYLEGLKVGIGGAGLTPGLLKLAEKYGIKPFSGYGLSESCPVLTIAVYNNKVKKMSEERKQYYRLSTGIPMPLVHVKVVNSSGNEVPWDGKTIGEIVVRAPWLTKEYFKDEEKTNELWRDGWMHTGDLAFVDPEGYLHIVDREKDAVKSGGEFIPSMLIENVISEIPQVAEVAIIGKPDLKWGERPVAFITLKENTDKKSIYGYLEKYVSTGRIQKWWIPDDIIFIKEMPKTSTNKIDKKELKKLIENKINKI